MNIKQKLNIVLLLVSIFVLFNVGETAYKSKEAF